MFQTVFKLSDAAISILFLFILMFFKTISRTLQAIPESFLVILPQNIRSARLIVSGGTQGRDGFVQYVCCPSCHSLYRKEDCVISNSNELTESRKCSFMRYPNHPPVHHRKPCSTVLLKKVKTPTGKIVLHPKAVYCYKSIIESLDEMLQRKDFVELCEEWRDSVSSDGVYNDVYDGKIWKEFASFHGKPFLSIPFNYALHLNLDWFQPFDHTQHSEGVMYLSVFNIPRRERFHQQNIIVVGVIPGPKEPELHINSFLQPLVDDLKKLWKGVQMITYCGVPVLVRAALLFVGCDIPAARKVSGFVGHRATMGCSRCLSSFPTEHFGDKPDYSNFDRSTWTIRDIESHKAHALHHRDCNTKSDRVAIEWSYGVMYSCLLQLPYFNPPRMCIIDPMHNLFLGTAKHCVDVWKSTGLLSTDNLLIMQMRVNDYFCPSDIGRIPSKIQSSFAGFTADQWRSWTVLFSFIVLKMFCLIVIIRKALAFLCRVEMA